MAEVRSLQARIQELARRDRRLITFGVRHHSPACAAQLRALIETARPARVLIEGPHTFNDRIHQLANPVVEPPVALFTFVSYPASHELPPIPGLELAEAGAGLEGRRRFWAWYPFCAYSPERVAIVEASRRQIPVRFCDLSFHAKLHVERTARQRRLSARGERDLGAPLVHDHALVQALCERVRARDMDELWDHLFELDGASRSLDDFMRDVTAFGLTLRECHTEQMLELQGDRAREAFMAARIREALDDTPPDAGPVLLVCGAMHLAGVEEALADNAPEPQIPDLPRGAHAGIHLSEYDFTRMSRLRYAAGMPAPEWYQELWERGASDVGRVMLTKISRELRRRGLPVSTAELLGAVEMASRLARFRAHPAPSRCDALDAARSCWIKGAEDSAHGNILHIVHSLFRGERVGRVGALAGDPPLLGDVFSRLEELGLDAPSSDVRELRLRPHRSERDQRRARMLRRLQYLEIPYGEQVKGPDLLRGTDLDRVEMLWRLRRTPNTRARLLECTTYGPTLQEAVGERLRERVASSERSASAAVTCLTEACVLGLPELLGPLLAEIGRRIEEDASLSSVLRALHGLVLLHRYRDVLSDAEQPALAPYIAGSWRRALVLLDDLARVDAAGEADAVRGLSTLSHAAQTLEHAGDAVDPELLYELLEDKLDDYARVPGVHGAAGGLLWSMSRRSALALAEDLRNHVREIPLDPEIPGRYLEGMMGVARRAWLEHPALLEDASGALLELIDEAFRAALPRLRRAHAILTPSETAMLARAVARLLALQPSALTAPSELAPDVAAALTGVANHTRHLLESWGWSLEVERWEAPDDAPAASPLLAGQIEVEAVEDVESARFDEAARELLRVRWRLILGRHSAGALAPGGLQGEAGQLDDVLGFLYDREYAEEGRELRLDGRGAGLGPSQMQVPDWINGLERLFPRRTVERLEAEALERYGLEELVTNPDVLERCEPSMALLEAILRVKHKMNPRVLEAARRIVRVVASELREQLLTSLRAALSGRPRRGRPTPRPVHGGFDPVTTIRRNLKNWDPERGILVIERPWFRENTRRYMDWDVILCVDQSGSMLSSMIHAGVMASIFYEIRELSPKLVVFDTSVVDLTPACQDPVETLLSVQLGGGTDIGQAVGYCASLVERPDRSIFVLVTDLFEGSDPRVLLGHVQRLIEGGVRVLILAALDDQANPVFDRNLGGVLKGMGAEVAALTPEALVAWVAEVIR